MLANKALSAAPSAVPVYVEDIFSSYLYTGNGSTQTITNNIDLSTKGGLVWTKGRSGTSRSHFLNDSVRGIAKSLSSNTTSAEDTRNITSFNSDGYTTNADFQYNANGETFVSWTFAQQEKFFDVVTYTGTGSTRTVSHNLGSVPGCIIVKRTSTAKDWAVYHRSVGNTKYLTLNSTAAAATVNTYWNDTDPTSTVFTVGTDGDVNANGETYVAYLFAHDAGGFGASGSDNVISCGSYTGTGSAQTISLGYEPQWILIKQTSNATAWNIWDNMRGMLVGGTDPYLQPNSSAAEDGAGAFDFLAPTATGITIDPTSSGYNFVNFNGGTYIYIAIRRGPMKTPTSGTSVFYPKVHSGSSSYSVGFPTDVCFAADQSGNALNTVVVYRLAGNNKYFGGTASTAAEQTVSVCQFDLQNSFQLSYNNNNQARWHFRRAPGFFDVVCYTGSNSSNLRVTHNLGVAPELIIVKSRESITSWPVYVSSEGRSKYMYLNSTQASTAYTDAWGTSNPTTTDFGINATDFGAGFRSGGQVAYLFASVTGVSKVGSYTGTGTTQTINCGFTAGSRFVLIKRTDSTGDWYVWDSARGIVSGNDPYLLLNSTAAEVTNTDYIDTANSGFEISSTAPAAINANGGTFVFLAIA
jgi:hypothetical protein